jgi:hypothetical protein
VPRSRVHAKVVGAVLVSLLAVPLIVGGDPGSSASAAESKLRVTAVSTKPGYVTGGDVLLRLRPAVSNPRFSAGGENLTASELTDGAWLVRGLRNGPSRIQVRADGGSAALKVVNHPISGPVFSGPHVPLLCTFPEPAAEPSRKATCADATTIEYAYKSTDGTIVPISGPDQRPADLATTTVDGKSVPYIVRVERGVINRSPYSFAVLEDADGWNRRLVYEFGGGCGTSYSQGGELGTEVVDDRLLSKGYAVATANFNTFQTSCNDVLSAETAMMVKEHVAETIGAPRFTIGAGGSGGAIQQLLIAQNYPGILDALSPVVPFPDAISVAPGVSDCGLLAHYYESPAGQTLTDAQQAAINGHQTTGTCRLWISSFLSTIDPSVGCDPQIPADRIYSAANPGGIRCTLQDLNRNEFGIDPVTGFARRPLDNVGVQYGLRALNAGTITVDQFLDLNESVGGYDINGGFVAERETARRADFRRAYETGRVLSGGGGMRDLPIITVNLYSDPYGDIHDRFRLFTIRDRLRGKNGQVNVNEKIWTRGSSGDIVAALTGTAFDPAEIVALLDEWLTSGEQPEAAEDNCTDADGTIVSGPRIYDEPGPCRDLYPVFGDARTAAGAPIINDRLKCRVRPVDPARYKVELTAEQAARLAEIFPEGVCNWRRRGVGQVPLAATWINYGKPPWRATK